jgi:hypothetical protein
MSAIDPKRTFSYVAFDVAFGGVKRTCSFALHISATPRPARLCGNSSSCPRPRAILFAGLRAPRRSTVQPGKTCLALRSAAGEPGLLRPWILRTFVRRSEAALLIGSAWAQRACGSSVPRLDGAFGNVDVAIDYLEVWQAPIGEQLRPRDVPVFLPYAKQGDPVIYFGVPPQPSACLETASPLKTTQKCCLAIRRIPELPGNNASTVPNRFLV